MAKIFLPFLPSFSCLQHFSCFATLSKITDSSLILTVSHIYLHMCAYTILYYTTTYHIIHTTWRKLSSLSQQPLVALEVEPCEISPTKLACQLLELLYRSIYNHVIEVSWVWFSCPVQKTLFHSQCLTLWLLQSLPHNFPGDLGIGLDCRYVLLG